MVSMAVCCGKARAGWRTQSAGALDIAWVGEEDEL